MGRPWVRAQGPTRHKAWVRVFAVLARQWTASPQPSASHPATFSQSYPQAKPSQRRSQRAAVPNFTPSRCKPAPGSFLWSL